MARPKKVKSLKVMKAEHTLEVAKLEDMFEKAEAQQAICDSMAQKIETLEQAGQTTLEETEEVESVS